jgi:hypothetical protein
MPKASLGLFYHNNFVSLQELPTKTPDSNGQKGTILNKGKKNFLTDYVTNFMKKMGFVDPIVLTF